MSAPVDIVTILAHSHNKRTAMLAQALNIARTGQTVIVIAPDLAGARAMLNTLIYMLDKDKDWHARGDYNAPQFYFEGTRGSVRFYTVDHVTFDAKQKRLLDYPAGQPTFIDPSLELP